VLDDLESDKQPPILSLACEAQAEATLLQQVRFGFNTEALQAAVRELAQYDYVGAALQQLTSHRLIGFQSYGFKNENAAQTFEKRARAAAPLAADLLSKALGLKIMFADEQNSGPGGMGFPGGNLNGPGAGGSGFGTGPGPAGALNPLGPRGMQTGGSGPPAGAMNPGMGPRGMQTGGGGAGSMPPRGGSGFPQLGGEQPGGVEQPSNQEREGDASTLRLRSKDKVVTLHFDLNLKDAPAIYEQFVKQSELAVLLAKGREDMGGRSRVHEMAAGLKAFVTKNQRFPRGTIDRNAADPNSATERAGLPWPPDQRVSWLAELLPYLGQGEFAGLSERIQRGRSWNDTDNLQTAQTLIPYYLSHDYPQSTWWGIYPGVTLPVAETHFVGVAGVGIDAAEYLPGDPATAKKLGIFGYDRATRVADVKDGLDKTIAVLQVPADFRTPWLAGGGSTVRGVTEKASIRPFVCLTYNGKRGTFAIMADGRVRFVPETIADADFQALCTIDGGESVEVEKLAPLVPSPAVPGELKSHALAPAAPALPALPPIAPTAPATGARPVAPAAPAQAAEPDPRAVTAVRNNCANCHTAPRHKGNAPLFSADGKLTEDATLKQKVAEVLAAGKMPPKNRPGPRPTAEDIATIQDWANVKR
jgi:hypothetical protein